MHTAKPQNSKPQLLKTIENNPDRTASKPFEYSQLEPAVWFVPLDELDLTCNRVPRGNDNDVFLLQPGLTTMLMVDEEDHLAIVCRAIYTARAELVPMIDRMQDPFAALQLAHALLLAEHVLTHMNFNVDREQGHVRDDGQTTAEHVAETAAMRMLKSLQGRNQSAT